MGAGTVGLDGERLLEGVRGGGDFAQIELRSAESDQGRQIVGTDAERRRQPLLGGRVVADDRIESAQEVVPLERARLELGSVQEARLGRFPEVVQVVEPAERAERLGELGSVPAAGAVRGQDLVEPPALLEELLLDRHLEVVQQRPRHLAELGRDRRGRERQRHERRPRDQGPSPGRCHPT